MQDEIVKSLDVFWPALAKTPAMKIGGCDSVDSLCLGHWKKMALELNLGFAQLLRRLRGFCGEIHYPKHWVDVPVDWRTLALWK